MPPFPLAHLQPLPANGQFITTWSNADEAFKDVVEGFSQAIQELAPKLTQRSSFTQPVWNVPYPRNPLFTGREKLLDRLRSHLTATRSAALTQAQAISCLGGIGKTQTAVEYAYRYRDQYRYILWATAATRESLGLDFVKLASLLQLPQQATQDQNLIVISVKTWLAQHQDWLLILDNADDIAMTSAFLPDRSSTNGHILLTTRADVVGTLANPTRSSHYTAWLDFIGTRGSMRRLSLSTCKL